MAKRLASRLSVGDVFTVADAYFVPAELFRYVGADLKRVPKIDTYHTRHLARPSVKQAMTEEMAERQKRAA
jgi:glutathione S-transferase